MKKLSIDDMKYEKPDFNGSDLPKSQIISAWLIDWVKYALELAIADIGDFIPTKEELAKFLDVSPTTVQNAIRYAKNSGYFISKQSSGTSIADFYSKDLTSQDELNHGNICEYKIKKIIIDDKIPLNSTIPSVKDLSLMTNISQNTIRQALLNMTLSGYLEKQHLKGNKFCWIYKKELHLSHQEIVDFIQDENLTLTRQLIKKIKDYIEKTYKQGDKILPNQAFANMFDVSIKTVNDAMKVLNIKGYILSRRGRYGTIYLGETKNFKKNFISSEKKKIIPEKYEYSWQKALEHIKKYMGENFEEGDKLPSIRELASILNISTNTIRRALKSLVENGNLYAKTGKSGGIFINSMPEVEGDSYRWLALNPDIIKSRN